MIILESVSKTFNSGLNNEVHAVRDVSLQIGKGTLAVLKGPSGSGKTSLLGLIGCMSRPTSGRILVNGRDIAKLPERFLTGIRRQTFGFIFQQFNLIQGVSVLDNVMLPLFPTPVRHAEIRARAEALLDRLSISKRKHFSVQELSGGEQQRVAIARALVNNPEALLADEPTAHLDTALSRELIDILHHLRDEGTTVIIATHDPLIYEKGYLDLLVEMRDGRVISTGAGTAGA